ncbi:S8 family serine peptidase [Natronospira bacteriovora]|uniref:S8 family serine peptidase n=1 Tax=Natronospira bacteriovora TaxID=3069753 RepID=A0ABU0W7P9_9GAMM|nr:S8 family serine peptidase [Natronospira sp. AB-CW4]MDQ2069944.1 S8 family serine peptidase [Natronospira sp. AB-CW4]
MKGLGLVIGTILATTAMGSMLPATASSPSERPVAASTLESASTVSRITEETLGVARYLVVLQDAPAASYRGGVLGFPATSPAVTGASRLDHQKPQVQAYAAYLEYRQDEFLGRAANALGRSLQPGHRFQYAINGLVLELTASEASRLQQQPDVARIVEEQIDELMTDTGPGFIGADALWEGSHGAGLQTRGEGLVVGILDTGINPTHPSFAEVDPNDGYTHVNPLGSGNFLGACDPGSEQYDADFPCNDKLIGAWSFIESWGEESAWDENGHGTHVAGTAAGNHVTTTFQGVEVDISGVAPRANIISYRVCGGPDTLCNSLDRAAAIEQSILDGVDVLNHSIGGGINPYTDATSLAFLGATDAGIFSATAAGNSGPEAGTVGHRTPWMITVAATTHSRLFARSVDITGPGTVPAELQGLAGVVGTGPAPDGDLSASILYAGDHAADDFACTALPEDSMDGAIALVRRGNCTFIDKANNAANAGAIALLVVNNAGGPPTTMGGMESATIPSLMVGKTGGDAIIDWVSGSTDATATMGGTTERIQDPDSGDTMAGFSSRGPGGPMADVIKPDIAAPGVSILAAYVPDNDSFVAIQGTSMASPHIAGAGALIRAVHPGWSPMEVQSALMSTAVTSVMDTDGETPADAFDMGAGRVDLDRAVRAALLLDETRANFEAAETGDLTTLNLASFANMECDGSCSWTRELRSVLGDPGNWTITVNADTDLLLSVDSTTFALNHGETHELTLTADVSAAEPGEWLFGEVVISEDADQAPSQRFPVAVRKPVPVEYGHYTMTTSLEDASCAMPLANSGGYTDFRPFGLNPNAAVSGDTFAFNVFGTRTFPVAGREFVGMRFTDDGFATFGDGAPASPWVNRSLDDLAGVTALLAPMWRDWVVVYEEGQRGVTLVNFGTGNAIDWKGVQAYGDPNTRMDFQLYARNELSPTAHDIVFAYDNVRVDDSIGTVGLSADGGDSYRQLAFNGASIDRIYNGMAVCLNWVADVSEPQFVPNATGFTGADFEVVLEAYPQTASLRYTLDGTDPDPDTGTEIANGGSITVSDGTEVRVIAYEGGHVSDVVIRTFQQLPPLSILDGEGDPLESVVVAAGGEVSFSVSGGSGTYSSVSSSPNLTSGQSATVHDDGDGNYRFVAPTTGAFAGLYEVTVTDESGMQATFTVEVSLLVEVDRSLLLGGAESAEIHVRGAVPGTGLSLLLQDGEGSALPAESVASLADGSVTASDEPATGNPASTMVEALEVDENSEFRVHVSGSPYSNVVSGTTLVQAASWYAGQVADMAGDAIANVSVRALGISNELSEPYRTHTGEEGNFLLAAPRPDNDDPHYTLSASADDFQIGEIAGDLCLGSTPSCVVYLEGATAYLTVGVENLLDGEEADVHVYFDTIVEGAGEIGPFTVEGSAEDELVLKALPLDGALIYNRVVATGFGYEEQEVVADNGGFVPEDEAGTEAQLTLFMEPTSPMVSDLAVSDITATSAHLSAILDPNQRVTTVSFILDDGDDLHTLDAGEVSANAEAGEVSVTASNLACGSAYSFFLYAENDRGMSGELDAIEFQTMACPVSGGGSSRGCTLSDKRGPMDPTLPLLFMLGMFWLLHRRRSRA